MVEKSIVWIVDDVATVRASTCALLETYDIAARSCASAAEFLAAFDGAAGGCLLVDLHMPEMNGIGLLQLLRRRGEKIPVILMTGRGDEALAEAALRAGAMAMLHKPLDDQELLALIQAALRANP